MEVDADSKADSMSDRSSETSDDDNAEVLKKIDELDKEVLSNPNNYDAHVQLITGLRSLADLDKLRLARNQMSKQFPLTQQLWLDWLEDERKIATSPEEINIVKQLFERAVKDYLSVQIWQEYGQFTICLDDSDSGVENARKIFERALAAAGLHVVKGASLWESYIEFEVRVLSAIESKSNETFASQSQKKRIANLFKRQLSCPLLGMDDTFETFNMWLVDNTGSLDSDIIDRAMVENVYKKAKEKLSKIEQYENNLATDISANYKEYIEHEKSKDGSPSRVLCLYERILPDLCLEPSIWLEYIEYINTVLKDASLAIEVARRGIRNCTWNGALPQVYLRLLEKNGATHQQMNEAVEECLSSNTKQGTAVRDVWLSYLEYMRRRYDNRDIAQEEIDKRLKELRTAFEQALEHISAVEYSDPEYAIAQFYARVEFKSGGDVEKARQIWTDILSDPHSRPASFWLEYINLEAAFGDTKHLLKLYPRALQHTTDYPEVITHAWLNFERDEGTLESFEACMAKCLTKVKEIEKKREEAQRQEAMQDAIPKRQHMREDRRNRQGLGYQKVDHDKKISEDRISRKRQFDQKNSFESSPEKKKKFEEATLEGTADIVNNLLSKNGKEEHQRQVKHDHSKDNRTVFVSNLDYSTTEETIRDIFAEDGTITDLRLVKDFKNRSKGYCYVEFQTVEMALVALKRDRYPIEERPMYVSKCDPDTVTRGKAFRYGTGLEKNKLFVKGLPFALTETELRDIFSKYGTLKDVRLVTFRNGHSKGLAYVDFEDEVSASQAVLKADGTTIGDRQISVAISNPPGRQNSGPLPMVASLGGGPKDVGPRGKARTQLAFLPRSVQLGPTAKGIEKMTIASPQPPQ